VRDLTECWGERARGLGERSRVDQGRTRLPVRFAQVLARVVIHEPALALVSAQNLFSSLHATDLVWGS
jgi:hypothetical protein